MFFNVYQIVSQIIAEYTCLNFRNMASQVDVDIIVIAINYLTIFFVFLVVKHFILALYQFEVLRLLCLV